MVNLGEALHTWCCLASLSCGKHGFSEAGSVSFCSRMVTQHLSAESEGAVCSRFLWVEWLKEALSCILFIHASGNKQQQRLIARECQQDYSPEEMVCDKESPAAKGFYSPFQACFMFKHCFMWKKASDILSGCTLFFKSRWF